MTAFADHFHAASGYARYRPRYPPELFAFLAEAAPRTDLCWDCATGSGQAAAGSAQHFARVVATDASLSQLGRTEGHPGIQYAAALASDAPLPSGSIDLVTVAQALHWFDLEAFYREVRRVARPLGVLAAWTYPLLSAGDDVDPILHRFAYDTVGPWWPPEGRHVRTRYRELEFPFARIDAPPFTSSAEWTLDHLAGYLDTWSAMQRYRRDTGEDPLPDLIAELTPVWGERRVVRWDLRLLVGKVSG